MTLENDRPRSSQNLNKGNYIQCSGSLFVAFAFQKYPANRKLAINSQSSINFSAIWSKGWELDHNPTTSLLLTPPTLSLTPSKDPGSFLNARLYAEDNVLYLRRSFAALAPNIFLPLFNFFVRLHHEHVTQASHPIPRRQYVGKGTEDCPEVRGRTSACPAASIIL